MTEGGAGTWHRVGPEDRLRCSVASGEEHWTQNWDLYIQFSALFPTSCDIRDGGHFPVASIPKGPFQPPILEASEQAKALQKGLPGCQFKVELAVGGAGERTPQFSHFTLLEEGEEEIPTRK